MVLFLSVHLFADTSEGLEKEVKDIIEKMGIKPGSNLTKEQRINLEKSMIDLLSKQKRTDDDKVAIYTILLQVFINEDPKKAVDYLDRLSDLKKDNDDSYLQFQQVKAYLLGVPLGDLKAQEGPE